MPQVRCAVNRARAGDGSTFIEAKTYRYVGHSRSDKGVVPARRGTDCLTGA